MYSTVWLPGRAQPAVIRTGYELSSSLLPGFLGSFASRDFAEACIRSYTLPLPPPNAPETAPYRVQS